MVADKKLTVVSGARFMALASVAMGGAIIAVFDDKYHYDCWRPITAIRNGDPLNPRAITEDATWQSIDGTRCIPSIPGPLSVAAACAAVVTGVIGTDLPPISATSPNAFPSPGRGPAANQDWIAWR